MKKNDPNVDYGFHAVIPRMVRTHYKEVKPLQKWLYTCLKDLCGEAGTCYRTIETLAEETGISNGYLSESIPALHDAGLIHAEKKRRTTGGKPVWHITIVDIWQANAAVHPTKRSQREQTENIHTVNVHSVNDNSIERSQDEHKRSQREREYSQCETEEESIEAVSESSIILEAGEESAFAPRTLGTLSASFDDVEEESAPDDDALAETIKAPTAPKVPSHIATMGYSDSYAKEGDDDAQLDVLHHSTALPARSDPARVPDEAPRAGHSRVAGEEGGTDSAQLALVPSEQTPVPSPSLGAPALQPDGEASPGAASAAAPNSSGPRRSGERDHSAALSKKVRGGKAREEPLLCEPAKVKAWLVEFRGYALAGKGAIINEHKLIHEWCEQFSEEVLALVKAELPHDRYWGKPEHREHFQARNLLDETPRVLSRLKRRNEPRVLADGAQSEWNFADYVGNGPEAIERLLARSAQYDAQGLYNI